MLDDEGTLGHVEEEEEEEEEREEEECWWRGILLPQLPICENLEGVLFPRIFSDEAMESVSREGSCCLSFIPHIAAQPLSSCVHAVYPIMFLPKLQKVDFVV